MFGLLRQRIPDHRAHQQQYQWQQINQAYSAQYRAFSNRYDDLVADAGIDWIVYLELAWLTAKQLGQLTRPAPLAIALLATISLADLNLGKLPFSLDDDGTRLQHVHFPL